MDWLRQNWTKIRGALIGLGLVGLVAAGWAGVGLYRQRKAIETEIAARHQAEQRQQEAGASHAQVGADGQVTQGGTSLADQPRRILDFSGNTVEWNGRIYKRNTYIKAFLCIGVDRAGEMTETTTTGFGGQCDGIYVIAQDTARGSIQILMVPRDTMTKITMTDLSGNVLGKDLQHLLLAYAFGDGREKSCEFTKEAVSDLFGGFSIDRYMAVDTSVVSVLNDAVGGVEVTVPTDGMEVIDPSFTKGSTVLLKGKLAERFVRYRDVGRDHSALLRMNQQQEYITGFFDAVRSTSRTNSQIVPQLFDLIQNYMVTDMPKDEYLKIAVNALQSGDLTSDQIRTVPGTGVTTERYDEFYVDDEGLNELLLSMFYREG
ncbi:MAG: LCP family protein [Lachnospiraceae bacterium]|nr:LCP family protein [Lachnospiraceae bacterium]